MFQRAASRAMKRGPTVFTASAAARSVSARSTAVYAAALSAQSGPIASSADATFARSVMSASPMSMPVTGTPAGIVARRSLPSIPAAPKISTFMCRSTATLEEPSQAVARQIRSRRIEAGVLLILGRGERVTHRPRDVDALIRPQHAALVTRVVQFGALVHHVGDGRQHAEPVCEPGRDPQVPRFVAAQGRGRPAPERRRSDTDVHGHVEDRAADARHELALRPKELIVQATQHALR